MRPNQNRKPNKPKLIVTNFEKSFETFTEMINEFKTLHPEMPVIFSHDDEVVEPKFAAEDVLIYFNNNMPDIIDRINLPMSVSVSANAVTLKTNKFFSIKWNFKYDRNGFVTDLVATITVFSRERNAEELDKLISTLESEESGWNKVANTR